jgi:hypothetical protein
MLRATTISSVFGTTSGLYYEQAVKTPLTLNHFVEKHGCNAIRVMPLEPNGNVYKSAKVRRAQDGALDLQIDNDVANWS